MMRWQRRSRIGMRPADRKRTAAGIDSDIREILGHNQLAKPTLDRDLPNAGRRKVEVSPADCAGLRGRQALIVGQSPEQNMCVEKELHSDLARTEHLPDFGIPFEKVLRNRELPLQRADQWSRGCAFDRNDSRHGPPVASQFNRLTSFGTANQLGEVGLGFCDCDLHETKLA